MLSGSLEELLCSIVQGGTRGAKQKKEERGGERREGRGGGGGGSALIRRENTPGKYLSGRLALTWPYGASLSPHQQSPSWMIEDGELERALNRSRQDRKGRDVKLGEARQNSRGQEQLYNLPGTQGDS